MCQTLCQNNPFYIYSDNHYSIVRNLNTYYWYGEYSADSVNNTITFRKYAANSNGNDMDLIHGVYAYSIDGTTLTLDRTFGSASILDGTYIKQ